MWKTPTPALPRLLLPLHVAAALRALLGPRGARRLAALMRRLLVLLPTVPTLASLREVNGLEAECLLSSVSLS